MYRQQQKGKTKKPKHVIVGGLRVVKSSFKGSVVGCHACSGHLLSARVCRIHPCNHLVFTNNVPGLSHYTKLIKLNCGWVIRLKKGTTIPETGYPHHIPVVNTNTFQNINQDKEKEKNLEQELTDISLKMTNNRPQLYQTPFTGQG